MTANNAELYAWPIDLEQSRITLSAGEPVTVNIADYKITDPKLVLRSPLDSQLPTVAPSPAPLVLTGIYETVLRSFRSPGLSGHLNPANDGHFIFTPEFLLRGGIKGLLSKLGYENAWRSELWRTIDAACERRDALSPLLVAPPGGRYQQIGPPTAVRVQWIPLQKEGSDEGIIVDALPTYLVLSIT